MSIEIEIGGVMDGVELCGENEVDIIKKASNSVTFKRKISAHVWT